MAKNKLSIIIPAFKDHHKIRRCLQQLSQSSFTDLNIIVVDHSASNNITRWIRIEYPHVTCLRGSSDLWWSGAMNIGIKYALEGGSDLIMPLNHDCYVRVDTIGNMLNILGDVPDKIIAPIQFHLLRQKEMVCANSLFLLGFPTIVLPGRWCKYFTSEKLVSTGLIVGGRGAIIHADIFKSVGYFDEINLPHYGADHDFYLRCKKSGIKLYTCTNAIVDVDGNTKASGNNDASSCDTGLINSLVNRSSHRNIKDTYYLFSNHYPIPGLAILGMALYVVRYLIVYSVKKISIYFKRRTE